MHADLAVIVLPRCRDEQGQAGGICRATNPDVHQGACLADPSQSFCNDPAMRSMQVNDLGEGVVDRLSTLTPEQCEAPPLGQEGG